MNKPLPQVNSPELEAIREIALEMTLNWSFHEVAIADPFKAEEYVRGMGEKLQALVGWPKGVVVSQ